MNLSLIVENVEVDLSNLTEKVKEEIEFKIQNVYGVWYSEGRNLEELEDNLWNKLDNAIKDFEELNHLNNIALLYEMFEK